LAADGAAIQDFEYDDAWHPLTDGPGRSLGIRDDTAALAAWGTAAGWRPSAANGGTPGSTESTLCANGLDDDGDGDVDLADAGCAGTSADTEVPECDDGLDNDGDSTIDTADLQCASASGPSESPGAGDSFLCYQARLFAGPVFAPVTATVEDEFDGAVDYQVSSRQAVCMAGALDAVVPIDDSTHLRAYELSALSGQPVSVPLLKVRYENVLGPVWLDTGKPTRLLVPSAVDRVFDVAAPDFGSHGVDYYKCYRTKVSSNLPRYFPSAAQVRFSDDFEDRDYLLKPPSRVCTPASVDGSAIKTPGRHLLCYRATRGRYATTHVPEVGVHGGDLFGQSVFSTVREEEVCVPAVPVAD